MYRDFGVGQMGDMGAHTMDLLWNAIDAGAPTAIEVDRTSATSSTRTSRPVKLKAIFEHPANSLARTGAGGVVPGRAEAQRRRRATSTSAASATARSSRAPRASIFADFTSRIIIPNNDDGDLTYYKRRAQDETLPLIGGTGQVTQAAARPRRRPRRGAAAAGRGGRRACPAVCTAMPSAEPGPNGFPACSCWTAAFPPALGLPNPRQHPAATDRRTPAGDSLFQLDWIDACKGKSNNVVHGTSSKDPLRLRLLRHDDRADAARPGGAPGRARGWSTIRDRPRHQLDRSERLSEAHVPLGLDAERVSLATDGPVDRLTKALRSFVFILPTSVLDFPQRRPWCSTTRTRAGAESLISPYRKPIVRPPISTLATCLPSIHA